MKLQKKLTMLGVALATTGMLAVSNMSSVSAEEEMLNTTVLYYQAKGNKFKQLLFEYAFLYKNQSNPEAIIDLGKRKMTVSERLKEVPLSEYEKRLGLKKEELEKYRNDALKELYKVVNINGIWQEEDQGWRYIIVKGRMGFGSEGWLKYQNNWYYLDKKSLMMTGWIQDNGKWYFLQPSGEMATGWVQDNGKWYYLDASGALKTGWFEVGGKWYYAYASGELAVNTTIDGYTVNGNGEWV